MNKIIVIGCPGSGKTTLSNKLGEKLGIQVYHLDDWQTLPKEDFINKQNELMEGDKWVIDGNFVKTIGNRIAKADTVVFLDLSKKIVCWRFLKRSFKDFNRERGESAGSYLKEKWGVLRYIWNFPRVEIYRIIEQCRQDKKIIVLHNPKEMKNLLAGVVVN